MALPDKLPPLLPVTVAGIPASMLDTPRWAPWRAVWNEKKAKYEKIPHRADRPQFGLSSQSTLGWSTFHEAMAAYRRHPAKFAGVGYLMTGAHGLVAVDLDKCVKDGNIAPWAAEVVAKLDSYTEISPSGNGLRIMIEGEIDRDWTNHETGIEVYGGCDARFVTITGAKVDGSPSRVRKPRPGVMDQITARYRKAKTVAEVEDLHLPALLGDHELPDLDTLGLPSHARNFLSDGPVLGADRSRQLFATCVALNQAGLTRQEVLSILEANEHAMEVAMDHRKQDYDKTLRYLWKHHCTAGAARAEGLRQLDMADFEDTALPIDQDDASAAIAGELTETTIDDFDVLDGPDDDFSDLIGSKAAPESAAPAKPPRFTPMGLLQFMLRPKGQWIVKGVLPRAGLAVLYGASASGKTFFMLDLAAAVARGIEWRGHQVNKGRVVYVVAEGASGFRNRVDAYCRQNELDPADVDLLVIPDVPNLLDKAHIRELAAALKKVGPIAMIVIDTYARVMAGANENDAKDTGQAVAHCDMLHRIFNALVVLIHHSGKDATKGARGSGALRAAADVEIEVVRTREYRAATITKMKDGEDGAEMAFNLAEITIGMDEDGDPITSCVVEHRAAVAAQERKGEPKGDREKIVMRHMDSLMDMGGAVAKTELIEAAHLDLEFDPNSGGRDRRKEYIGRAIDILVRKNLLVDDGFSLSLA